MSTWRYVQNGQPSAPVETAALAALLTNGTLSPETYVWKEGMANWLAARTLPEFANCRPAAASAMPPVPTAPPPPPTSSAPVSAADDIEKNRAFGILAYLGILFLVPLLAAPHSRFAKFHANQGMILFLASLLAMTGSWMLTFFMALIPFLGMVFAVVMGLVGMLLLGGYAVLVIIGIVNAAGGQCKPLPLIGHFELIK
jgi:uncharacterized membrane protein